MKPVIPFQSALAGVFAAVLVASLSTAGLPFERPLLLPEGEGISGEVQAEAGSPGDSSSSQDFAAAVERATVSRVARLCGGTALLTLPRDATAAPVVTASRPPEWLTQLFASDKAETRLRAVELCAKKGGTDYLGYLVNALDDPDLEVRTRAAEALTAAPEEVLVERLLLALSSAESASKVAEHLPALRTQLGPRFRALLEDESALPTRRQLAAFGLGAMGDTDALDVLGSLAEQGEYPLAYGCAQALLALHSAEALPHWLTLSHHEDEQLRAVAIDGLAEAGGEEAVSRLKEVASGDGQSGPWLQVTALRYIGEQPAQVAVPALVEVMEQNAMVRQEIVQLLTKMTGWELGNDPALWRAWLENPQQFMPAQEGQAEEADQLVVEDSPLETLGTF